MAEITQPELAEILGVPVRQIRRWVADGYLTPTYRSLGREANTFDVDEILVALREYGLKVHVDAKDGLARARRRK